MSITTKLLTDYNPIWCSLLEERNEQQVTNEVTNLAPTKLPWFLPFWLFSGVSQHGFQEDCQLPLLLWQFMNDEKDFFRTFHLRESKCVTTSQPSTHFQHGPYNPICMSEHSAMQFCMAWEYFVFKAFYRKFLCSPQGDRRIKDIVGCWAR